LKGRVRANKSGCLDACELGPVVAIYPQGTWYLGVAASDVEEIIDSSVADDEVVERLVATDQDWERIRTLRLAAEDDINSDKLRGE
jgi:(2Fe-2S) ferredoxin